MTDINTWAAVDDSNNTAAPAGWPEGMMPSGVNNAARAMMGSLKRWRDQSQPTVTATGSGNAQIITYPVAPAALAAGDAFCFFALANTGAATLQVNAQAAKPIQTSIGTALIGGEMPAGAAIMVAYDGTNFRMLAAPTPLSISNGGTGVTTPGAVADAIGAVHDTGDTMTGPLTAPQLISTGTISATGNISGGSVTAAGSITGGSITSNGLLYSGGDIAAVGNIGTSAGTVSGHLLYSNGDISAVGDITGANIHANGNLTAAALGITNNASVGGTLFTHNVVGYANNAASVGVAGTAYSGMWAYGYTTVSDQSEKGDIQPLPPGSLDLVQDIMPHTYVMLSGPDQETRHAGFIAQEVNDALLAAGHVGGYVLDKDSGVAGLNYDELLAILWSAVQTLTARVDSLQLALTR